MPTGIEHGTVTVVADGTAVRSHHPARGRRDVRAPCHGGVRPRLEARRRAARLHHERAVGCRRDGTVHDYVGGLADIDGAARALHRRRGGSASPKTICASCGSSASTPPMARAALDPQARRLHRRAAPASTSCRASACAWRCSSSLVARHAVPTLAADDGGGPARAGARRRAAARELRQHDQARGARLRSRPMPVRRLGALARLGRRGRRAPARALAALQCGIRAAGVDGGRLVADRTANWSEPAARVLLYRLGRERFTDRVLLAWTRSPAGRGRSDLAGARDAAARWSAPAFPLKAADFMARGVPKGPRLGAALARGRGGVDRGRISERRGGAGGDRRSRRWPRRGDARGSPPRCDSLRAPSGITLPARGVS